MGGGSKKGGGSDASEEVAKAQTEMAKQLFEETQPLREGAISEFQTWLSGEPIDSTIYRPYRSTLEDQYKIARENMLASTQSGGMQSQLLSDLERGRAKDIANIEGSLRGNMFQSMLSPAFGTPSVSLGGLGQAGSTLASIQAAQAQAQGAKKGGAGQGLGLLGAGLLSASTGGAGGGLYGGGIFNPTGMI
jgi:hypothetical protein